MLGLFMIFVMGVVLALHIIVAYLFSKFGKDNYTKRFIFGSLGFLLVFSLFFGDHVVRKIQHQYLCTFKAKNVVYDKNLRDLFLKNMKNNKTDTVTDKKEIYDILKRAGINDNIRLLEFDPVLDIFSYTTVHESPKLTVFYQKDIHIPTKNEIYESTDYDMSCGWLFNKLNIVTGSCGFGSCKIKK
ncbi:MAG: hypothetical protein BWY78_00567 [Alphaproteobacteria bacterium ADurb.Bin438]|nr:MAG: hypothetical protein BWY78_00567 [Alphaproteobacteria bacterium ADurb.Bin438]